MVTFTRETINGNFLLCAVRVRYLDFLQTQWLEELFIILRRFRSEFDNVYFDREFGEKITVPSSLNDDFVKIKIDNCNKFNKILFQISKNVYRESP